MSFPKEKRCSLNAAHIRKRLRSIASRDVAKTTAGFFKTGPSQYGEGDLFTGTTVPILRTIALEFRNLSLTEIESLLAFTNP